MAWKVGTHLPKGPFEQAQHLGADALRDILCESVTRGLLFQNHADSVAQWLAEEMAAREES